MMDVSSINILLYCLNRLYFSPETWKNSILTYCYTFIYKWLWKFAKQCWENWMLIGKTIFICIKWILRLADHIEYCIWTMLMFNISCCHFGTSNVFFFVMLLGHKLMLVKWLRYIVVLFMSFIHHKLAR